MKEFENFIGQITARFRRNKEGQKVTVVDLFPGKNSWDVLINAKPTTWALAYPDYASLPIHNGFKGMINFRGNVYNFGAIFAKLIIVTGPVRKPPQIL